MLDSKYILFWFSLGCCSFGGLILDKTVSDPNFEGMAVFTPVINGKLICFYGLPLKVKVILFVLVLVCLLH